MRQLVVATFHVVDALDSTGARCGEISGEYMTRDGVQPPVPCSRRHDHQARGSDVHRAVRAVGEPPVLQDVYWTR